MSPVSPVFHTEETVIIAFKCFIIRGVKLKKRYGKQQLFWIFADTPKSNKQLTLNGVQAFLFGNKKGSWRTYQTEVLNIIHSNGEQH